MGESPLFYFLAGNELYGGPDGCRRKSAGDRRASGSSENIEVVDVQVLGGGSSRLLRIFIDKPEGVTHADCEFISQHVGTILDVEDVIPGGSYTLEVSSPGVERKLPKPQEFERFLGQKIKVVLREPVEGQRHWAGTVAELRGRHDHARTVARQERPDSARAGGKGQPEVRVVTLQKDRDSKLYEQPGNDFSIHRDTEQGKRYRPARSFWTP